MKRFQNDTREEVRGMKESDREKQQTQKCKLSLVKYFDNRKPVLYIIDEEDRKKKIVLH
jgi:hypothetical protein